jgi:uncharacterized protein YfaS (alpha-2-macroglobulin family)
MKKDEGVRYVDDLFYNALYLNILSRHFPQRLRDVSQSLFESMSAQLNAQNYTTMSANYSLMAIDAYLKASPGLDTGRYTVQELFKDKQKRLLNFTASAGVLFSADFSADAKSINLENRDQLNLFYQITAAGFEKDLPAVETKNGIEVFREFLNEKGQVVKEVKMGDVVTVRINVRSLSGPIHDLAIVDLLPAGLEADTASLRKGGGTWIPDYVDIREDRIVFYGTANAAVASVSYQARAVNSGNFTVPPLFAEAMYNKSVWAVRPQDKLRIAK